MRLTPAQREELSTAAQQRDADRAAGALGAARTCYGHLAGKLGVALTKRLFDLDWLRRGSRRRSVEVTAVGRRELGARLGI